MLCSQLEKRLDESSPGSLTEIELNDLNAHSSQCPACEHVFTAWLVAGTMLKSRAAEVVTPSPFFETQLLAILRERRTEAPLAIVAMWRATRIIFSSMVAIVVILAAMTLFAGGSRVTPDRPAVARSTDSVEQVMLGDNSVQTNGQVLDEVFGAGGSYAGN